MASPTRLPPPPLGPPAPFVFGYLRLPSPRPLYVLAVRRHLAWHCQIRGLRVGRVFVDEGYRDTTVSRPGFADMCYRIREQRPYGVLVLHPRDLSTDEKVSLHLASLVWDIGVHLLTVRGDLPVRPEWSTKP